MSVPQIPTIIWPTPNTIIKLLGVELLGLALLSNRADDENTICARLRDEGVLLKRLKIVNPTAASLQSV